MEINTEVQSLIDLQVHEGRQIGVQVAAYVNGENIVDVVAGTRGPDDDRPVEHDTLFLSFSSTKGPTALLVHQLAERGQLDYDAPVVEYWPAFGQNGKERITVAQAMSHQSGLHALPSPLTIDDICDWDASIARMETGVPAWEPATATGYHALTYGWIAGGIFHGVTGRHIQNAFRTEIAAPLGVDNDFFVGIPADGSVDHRLANLAVMGPHEALPMELPEDSFFLQAMPKALWQHTDGMQYRRACLPAGNGHFTAAALAKMYGALANGGQIEGTHLVGAEYITQLHRFVVGGTDLVLGAAPRKGIGFFLGGLAPDPTGKLVHGPMGPGETAFGHSGAGGSVGFADPELGLGMAVTLNKMNYPPPGEGATLEICDLVRSLL